MKEELEKNVQKNRLTPIQTNGTVLYLAVSTQSYFGTCPFKEGVGGVGVAVNECFWFSGRGRRVGGGGLQ